MPSLSTCRDEIETLHAFFVDWYTARIPETEFERMEQAIGPPFEMVTPDGNRHERTAVLAGVRDTYGQYDPGEFDIEIRNVESIESIGEYATVRYEEWQETPAETTGRISTVLFRDAVDAPGGVVWVDLHETWLDRGDG